MAICLVKMMEKDKEFKINSQGKVRVTLSCQTEAVLKDDLISFSFGEFNSFCNHVFSRYYRKANATISLRLEEARESYEKALKVAKNMRTSTRKKVVECMINGRTEEAIENLESNFRMLDENTTQGKTGNIESAYICLNKENVNILTKELNEKGEYAFHRNAGGYIRDVLEEYASLSHITREAIVRSEEIDTIEKCLDKPKNKNADKGCRLNIKMDYEYGSKTYCVIPYKIVSDPLNTRRYLIGYSFQLGQTEAEKKPVSFSLGRLNMKSISVYRRKKYYLKENEKEILDNMVRKNLTAYIIGGEKNIKVRLTPDGTRFYRNIVTSRPVYESIEKDKAPGHKNDMIYTFNCSPKQAENYFFTFGDEAEILEPESLRKKFAARYKAAMNVYIKSDGSDHSI